MFLKYNLSTSMFIKSCPGNILNGT